MVKTIVFSLLLVAATLSSFTHPRKPRTHVGSIYIQSNLPQEQFRSEKDNPGDVRNSFHRTSNSVLKANAIQRFDSVIRVGREKEEYTYDANGNMTQFVYYTWSSEESTWVKSRKWEYTTDANGNITKNIRYIWNAVVGTWVDSKKWEYIYNADGGALQEISYNWNSQENTWIDFSKVDFIYDDNGRQTRIIRYNWNSVENTWVEDGWTEYYYDDNGNVISNIAFSLNSNPIKEEYIYDDNGNMTISIAYSRSSDQDPWVGIWKNENTYDAQGNLTQYIYYYPNGGENYWLGFWKQEYTYDSMGNMTHLIDFSWVSDENNWVAGWKNEYTYDNSYTIDELMVPPGYIYHHKNVSFFHYIFNQDTEEWIEEYESVSYFSDLNTFVLPTETEKIIIYPNPVSDHLKLDVTNSQVFVIEILDMQGRKIMHRQINSGEVLDVGYLKKGIYMYNVYLEGLKQSGKFIKE